MLISQSILYYGYLCIDKEIPRMTNCPSSFTVYLEPGQSSQIVTWNEPIFTDNVEVVHLNKSKVSFGINTFVSK